MVASCCHDAQRSLMLSAAPTIDPTDHTRAKPLSRLAWQRPIPRENPLVARLDPLQIEVLACALERRVGELCEPFDCLLEVLERRLDESDHTEVRGVGR